MTSRNDQLVRVVELAERIREARQRSIDFLSKALAERDYRARSDTSPALTPRPIHRFGFNWNSMGAD